MNRASLFSFLTAAGLACMVAASVGSPASAQRGQATQPERRAAPADDSPKRESPLIKLNFAGGNAADYVAAVRKAAGGVNVFVAPEAREVPMPAIELNNVSVASALAVLNGRAANVNPNRTIQLHYDEGGTYSEQEQPIYSIQAMVRGNSGTPPSAMNQVWSVAELLNLKLKVDDILTAVQTALDLLGKDMPEAQLRFHEATGILIARAAPGQLAAIDDVLGSLKQAASARAKFESGGEKQLLMMEIQQRETMIQKLEARVVELESELAKASKKD